MDNIQRAKEQKERLNKLSFHLGISLIEIAELAGLEKNTIYHIGSGKRGEMSERTAARIAYNAEKKLGVVINREWLLDGIGTMIKEDLSVPVMPYKDEEPQLLMAAEGESTDWREKYFDLMEKYTRLLESRQS